MDNKLKRMSADPLMQGHKLYIHIEKNKAKVDVGLTNVGTIDLAKPTELAELLVMLASNDFYRVTIKHETVKEWERGY